jgi:phospholipid/cholesterol/gamma-HCH transport system substrate-binding protein
MLSACGFRGVNEYPLPLTKGGGDGSYEITVTLDNAAALVPNSEVKVGDVTVGSVRRIEFDRWRARLTLGLEKGVVLTGDATAKVGQKSLLGAKYLELSNGTDSSRRLGDGDQIPLASTSRYPATEDVLAALGALLSGGGLEQIQTIIHELNNTMGGHEADIRSTVAQLDRFVGLLDTQRHNLVVLLAQLDRMSGTFSAQSRELGTALDQIPTAIRVLRDEREQLTRTLSSVSRFGASTSQLIDATRSDLLSNLRSIQPTLSQLARSGKDLTGALGDITFPFPVEVVKTVFRGDYINFFATIDVTLPTLRRDWISGTPLDGLYAALAGAFPSGTATDRTDPLTPRTPHTPSATPPAPDLGALLGGTSGGTSSAPGAGSGGLLDGLSGLLGGAR